MARLSRAKIHVLRHKDVAAAENSGFARWRRREKLLISDGVFRWMGHRPLPAWLRRRKSTAHHDGGRRPRFRRAGPQRPARRSFGLDGGWIQVGNAPKAIGVLGAMCGSANDRIPDHRRRPSCFRHRRPRPPHAWCVDCWSRNRTHPRALANARYFKHGSRRLVSTRDQRDAHSPRLGCRRRRRWRTFSRSCSRKACWQRGRSHHVAKDKARVRRSGFHAKQSGSGRALEVFRKGREGLEFLETIALRVMRPKASH